MRLKHAEKKWTFEKQRRQTLEEENEKLKIEIAEAGDVQRRMFWHEEESGRNIVKVVHFIKVSQFCILA